MLQLGLGQRLGTADVEQEATKTSTPGDAAPADPSEALGEIAEGTTPGDQFDLENVT